MERFSPFGYVLLWEHPGYLETRWGGLLLSARPDYGEVGAALHPFGVRSTIGGCEGSEEWTVALFTATWYEGVAVPSECAKV